MVFKENDRVEVIHHHTGERFSLCISLHTATVLADMGLNRSRVRYDTRFNRDGTGFTETVDSADIRPCYPSDVNLGIAVSDSVETYVLHSWRVGTVLGIDGQTCSVNLQEGDRVSYDISAFRRHLIWMNGQWCSLLNRNQASTSAQGGQPANGCNQPSASLQQDLPGNQASTLPAFTQNQPVEIIHYVGSPFLQGISFYNATILADVGVNRYLVRYDTRFNRDGTRFTETVDSKDIQPLCTSVNRGIAMFDVVDAYNYSAWNVGTVTEIDGETYKVNLHGVSDAFFFYVHNDISDVRRHLRWMNGKWCSLRNRSQSNQASTSAQGGQPGGDRVCTSLQLGPPGLQASTSLLQDQPRNQANTSAQGGQPANDGNRASTLLQGSQTANGVDRVCTSLQLGPPGLQASTSLLEDQPRNQASTSAQVREPANDSNRASTLLQGSQPANGDDQVSTSLQLGPPGLQASTSLLEDQPRNQASTSAQVREPANDGNRASTILLQGSQPANGDDQVSTSLQLGPPGLQASTSLLRNQPRNQASTLPHGVIQTTKQAHLLNGTTLKMMAVMQNADD